MIRERATAAPDLPHRFDPVGQRCRLCGHALTDLRHQAFEKAAAAAPTVTVLARELGT